MLCSCFARGRPAGAQVKWFAAHRGVAQLSAKFWGGVDFSGSCAVGRCTSAIFSREPTAVRRR